MTNNNKENYIQDAWDASSDYQTGVLNGTIKTNENIRLAIIRHQSDIVRPDLEFRRDAVEKVYSFFSYLFLDKGKRLILQPFQAFIIEALFGLYYRDTNIRKYLYAFLFIGRKNGKTSFAAALQLYFMLKDGISFPHSVLIAGSQSQAIETSFEALKEIIKSSPALSKRLLAMKSNRIVFADRSRTGSCRTVPAIEDRLEGLNPSSCILDEIHTYKDAQKFNVIKNALGTKENPMLFLISTAGYGKDSFCAQLVETGRNVLRNVSTDDRFFYMLYELEEGDDINDESNWIKANPGLGTILDYRTFKDQFHTNKSIPSLLSDFITKRFNMFLEENSQWIESHILDAAFGEFTEEKVKNLPCYIGLDLSSTRDLTSIVCLWDGGDHFYAKSYFFFVESEKNSLRKGNIDIKHWVDLGYIKPCTTKTIDYEMVAGKIRAINNTYDVKGLYYDPWHFDRILNEVKEAGIWCVPIQPGPKNFDGAIRFLESLMYGNMLTIKTNSCMKWNFRNLVITSDWNGSQRPDKNKSADATDGVISLLNCIAGHLKANANAAQIFLNAI